MTPLHGWVHALPVFRSLRAPARYVLLLDFALAVLAARGLDALREKGVVATRALWAVAGAAVLACGLPLLEPLWRGRLAGDGWQDASWATGSPLLLGYKWLLPPLWLGLTALWLGARRRLGAATWSAAGVLLVTADLGTFAATWLGPYWVRPERAARPDAAQSLAASAAPGRVFVANGPEPWRSASDLPLVLGFASLNSYVSLPLARHAAYMRAFWLSDQTASGPARCGRRQPRRRSWRRPLEPRSEIAGEEFSPRHPLFGLGPSAAEHEVRLDLTGTEADRFQLVTTLQDGAAIPQGAEVAVVTLEAMAASPPLRFVLRAGYETAERLHDERTAHASAAPSQKAWSLIDRRSEGAFYLARFAWPETRPLRALRIEYMRPRRVASSCSEEAWAPGTRASPCRRSWAQGFGACATRRASVLYENVGARPRAYAVHRIVRVETPAEAVQAIASGAVRPDRAVVVEDATAPTPTGTGPSTVRILADQPTHLELDVNMMGDGYVVLADTWYPGWQATVDGTPTTLYAANGLFRTVFVPNGPHHVRFGYTPRALYRGLSVTLITLVAALVLLVVPGKPSVAA